MKRTIYIAGGSLERMTVRQYIERLRDEGWEITHDWTRDPGYENPSPKNIGRAARNDHRGVMEGKVFWLQMPEDKSEGSASELGMAIAAHALIGDSRIVIASGPRVTRNLFCGLDCVSTFESHDAALAWVLALP